MNPTVKHIYLTYDKYAKIFFGPIVFENHELAYAAIRRLIRDMYHKNEVTYDELCDTKFVHVGDLYEQTGEIVPLAKEDFAFINAHEFVDGDGHES